MMNSDKTSAIVKRADPVLPDQGGRSMPVDPFPAYSAREQAVRQRAYEIYEQRGRQQGRAVDDWLAAETEITTADLPPAKTRILQS
jgi:Protein of unknown function (DUF2934)